MNQLHFEQKERRVSWDHFSFSRNKASLRKLWGRLFPCPVPFPSLFPQRKPPSGGWHISFLHVFLYSHCICPTCEWYEVGLCVFRIHIPGFITYVYCDFLEIFFFSNSLLGHIDVIINFNGCIILEWCEYTTIYPIPCWTLSYLYYVWNCFELCGQHILLHVSLSPHGRVFFLKLTLLHTHSACSSSFQEPDPNCSMNFLLLLSFLNKKVRKMCSEGLSRTLLGLEKSLLDGY